MQNADTKLAIIGELPESRMLGKLACPVREGADGKGRSRLPVTAVALRAHEPRHKPYLASRLPHTMLMRWESRNGGLSAENSLSGFWANGGPLLVLLRLPTRKS